MTAAGERDFDLVLYGATGFTGRRAAEYLASHADAARLRWAVAGRDAARLRALAERLRASVGVIVADSGDRAAVDAMARRTRVLLSTAGPFARYGTPVVDACVRARTHYADITGETTWVRDLVDAYHDRASADGTRVVPCCGFDSVPSDLGALLAARRVQDTLGAPCHEVRGYFRLKGGLNGGTAATALEMARARRPGAGGRFLLDPPGDHDADVRARSRDARGPRYDALGGTWVAPFVMAPTNTRVVRRSAALFAAWGEPYGPSFAYNEWMRTRGRVRAVGVAAGLGLFAAALARAPTRALVARLLPKPGEGPSDAEIAGGFYTLDLLAMTADGRQLRGRLRHQGDPGNHATVRYLCESGLALALDELPGGAERGGVLTPATALGTALARRIQAAGTEIAFD